MLSETPGLPSAVAVPGANPRDSQAFEPLVLGMPASGSGTGRRGGPGRGSPPRGVGAAAHRCRGRAGRSGQAGGVHPEPAQHQHGLAERARREGAARGAGPTPVRGQGMTSGISGETADGMSPGRTEHVIDALRSRAGSVLTARRSPDVETEALHTSARHPSIHLRGGRIHPKARQTGGRAIRTSTALARGEQFARPGIPAEVRSPHRRASRHGILLPAPGPVIRTL